MKTESPSGVARVVERNIRTLLESREAEERRMTWADRLAMAITRFTGSMSFVLLHLIVFGGWIAINLGWIPRVPRFDPTFVALAMVASVEAIFLSTFILITQNRMMAQAERRADLDLHISLLAEHEITRVISLTRKIARRMGISEADLTDLDELERDVAPEQVLERMDRQGDRPPPEPPKP